MIKSSGNCTTTGLSTNTLQKYSSSLTYIIIISVSSVFSVLFLCFLCITFLCRNSKFKSILKLKPYSKIKSPENCGQILRRVATKSSILSCYDKLCSSIDLKDLDNYIKNHKSNDGFGFATEFETIDFINTGCWSITHPYSEQNQLKNRYTNIVPYDHSRVILQDTEGGKFDYINASFVDSYNRRNAYIATQGPLTGTIGNFWQMVYEQNCEIIVMLSEIEKHGCNTYELYWKPYNTTCYGYISVRQIYQNEMAFFIERRFCIMNIRNINNNPSERIIYHYQFISSIDIEIPSTSSQIIKFIKATIKHRSETSGPIIIHSDSSVGGIGVYICIESQMEQMEVEKKINVKGFLEHICQQRMELIQTNTQYVFIHDVLYNYYISRDHEVQKDVFSSYLSKIFENDINGSSILEEQFKMLQMNHLESIERRKSYNLANRRSSLLSCEYLGIKASSEINARLLKLTNSSYIQGYWKMNEYIVTEHPFEGTEQLFWNMVSNENCGIIVLLSNNDLPPFWPQDEKDSQTDRWRNINYCSSKIKENVAHYCFLINALREDYVIDCTLFQLKQWPTNISEAGDLLQILFEVHSYKCCSPIIIIDEFGGSKSGIFVSLSYLLNQLRNEDVVDVFFIVKMIYMERSNTFKDSDNVKFICDLVEFIIKHQNSYPIFKTPLPSYYLTNTCHQSLPSIPVIPPISQRNSVNTSNQKIFSL